MGDDLTTVEPETDDREQVSSRSDAPIRLAGAALLLAVVGVGLGAWGVLRPTATPAGGTIGVMSTDEAKAGICAASERVRIAVSRQTNLDPGPDPVAREAVAANARLAALGGGVYLIDQLDPATPDELSGAVREFATMLQEIGIRQLAGSPGTDSELVALQQRAQDSSAQIAGLCGG